MKSPEYSSVSSSVVDSAFGTGRPLSAHLLREWIRSANRAAKRSSCVYRWTGLGHHALITYAPARWRPATPEGTVTVRKTGGVTNIRVGATLTLTAGRRVGLAVWTDSQEGLEPDLRPSVWVTGTGSSQLVTWETPCPPDTEIKLTLAMVAGIDPTSDPLVTSANWVLPAAAFGDATWGTPTVGVGTGAYGGASEWAPRTLVDQYVYGQYFALSGARGWRVDPADGYAIQRNGYYVWVWDSGSAGGGSVAEVGTCEGTVTLGSVRLSPEVWLVDSMPRLVGRVYTMRQLPEIVLNSWAVYEG